MNFLFYYILRKFFVKLNLSSKQISLEKGLILKRTSVMPLSCIVRITARRTLLLRIFGAKEISVFSLNGTLKFYLKKSGRLSFLPKPCQTVAKPRFREIAFGAFIDTRALGGVFVFAAVLRKLSVIIGGEYVSELIAVFTKTAAELEKALGFFKVAVPRIAITLAVFALGSWVFAYIRKLLRLSGFRVSKADGLLFIESGVLTLYEHVLVSNSAAAVYCDTITCLAARRAPLYLRGVMLCPCVKRGELEKTLKTLCGFKIPPNRLSPPSRAFLGYTAAPLTWAGVFGALLIAAYHIDFSVMLLKTVLYSGMIISLYTAVLYLLYMYRSSVSADENFTAISSRRGLRLYTAVFPNRIVTESTFSQSIFQRSRRLCGCRLSLIERRSFTARQLPKNELLRRTPF